MEEKSVKKIRQILNSAHWGKDLTKEYIEYFKIVVTEFTEQHNLPQLQFEIDNNCAGYAGYVNGKNNKFVYNEKESIESRGVGSRRNYEKDEAVRMDNSRRLREGKYFALQVPIHEFTHYLQDEKVKEKDITKMNPYAIIISREILVQWKEFKYYLENHDEFFIEIEADYKANATLEEVLEKNYMGSTGDQFRASYKYRKKQLGEKIDHYFEPGGMCDEISKKADHLMKWEADRRIPKLLEQLPALALIYDEHGKKKSLDQILQERETALKNNLQDFNAFANVSQVYATIINTDKEYREEFEKRKQIEKEAREKEDDEATSTPPNPATKGYERKQETTRNYAGIEDAQQRFTQRKQKNLDDADLVKPINPKPEVKPVDKKEVEEIRGKEQRDSYDKKIDEEYKADIRRQEESRRRYRDLEQQEEKRNQGFSRGR